MLTYRALTGAQPFTGRTLAALSVAITRGHFVPASTACPSVPVGLDDWFARAFHCEPSERFPSADAMAEAFINLILLATSLSIEDEDTVSAFRKLERRSLPEREGPQTEDVARRSAGNTRKGLGAVLMGAPPPEPAPPGVGGGARTLPHSLRPPTLLPASSSARLSTS